MLVIRLQRTGRENLPSYRIVVAEKRDPVKTGFVEIVGTYLPTRDPVHLDVRKDRITHWVSKGAIPSDTVARLLSKHGMEELKKFIVQYKKKKSKSAPAEGAAVPAQTKEFSAAADTPTAKASSKENVESHPETEKQSTEG